MVNNEGLNRVMNNDVIRDQIMDQISPKSVDNFVKGFGATFGSKDKDRYMSMFKIIIPDRKWLIAMVQKGYTFTIVTCNMHKLMDLDRHLIEDKMKPVALDLALFVTKDEEMIPCREDFIATSTFLDGSSYAKKVINRITDTTTPKSRVVTLYGGGASINILTPIEDVTTMIPMFLGWPLYETIFMAGSVRRAGTKPNIGYTHLSKDGIKIVHDVPNKNGSTYTFEDAAMNLFSIQTIASAPFDAGMMSENLLYRINK